MGRITTTYLKQNASNYYYEATTLGFSVFAITVEKKQEEQPIAEEQANKTEEMPAEKQEQASCGARKRAEAKDNRLCFPCDDRYSNHNIDYNIWIKKKEKLEEMKAIDLIAAAFFEVFKEHACRGLLHTHTILSLRTTSQLPGLPLPCFQMHEQDSLRLSASRQHNHMRHAHNLPYGSNRRCLWLCASNNFSHKLNSVYAFNSHCNNRCRCYEFLASKYIFFQRALSSAFLRIFRLSTASSCRLFSARTAQIFRLYRR